MARLFYLHAPSSKTSKNSAGSSEPQDLPAGKEAARESLLQLINKLREVEQSGKRPEFTEADVGSKFILPFLHATTHGTRWENPSKR